MTVFVQHERFNVSKAVYNMLNCNMTKFSNPNKANKITLVDLIYALSNVSQYTQWGKELKYLQDTFLAKENRYVFGLNYCG